MGHASSPVRMSRLVGIPIFLGLLIVAHHGCGGRGEFAARLEGEPFSCQLHVHGSFSEGMGSIDSHAYEGSAHDLDVLWWSDHDFRATSYNHVTRFGFEELSQPQNRDEAWSLALERREDDTKGVRPLVVLPGASGALVVQPVREGERALRLTSTSAGGRFRPYTWTFETRRLLHRRPLAAQVVVRLAVFPEEIGPDARAFVRIDLSEHAPRAGLELGQYALRYDLTNEAAEPLRQGATYHVPVPIESGRWNELVLHLTEDAARGFPFLPGLPGEDHALFGISFGLETRAGARATLVIDDLRIDQELQGEEQFQRQLELLQAIEPAYPGLTQLQGVEISYAARHLNEFSVETGLLDYDALAREAGYDVEDPARFDEARFKELIVERAVEGAHARGGLVSWNHLFGVNPPGSERGKTPERMLEILLAEDAFGVDLLEVGYRDRAGASLADHLWVWDRAALAGRRLVGIGTSDAHGGPQDRWDTNPNNFVSWIYAAAPEKAALIEGLRAGRVLFGDLTRFDGALDLVTDAGHRMGREVLTDRTAVDVVLLGRGLPAGAAVRVIIAGEAVTTFLAADEAEQLATHRVEMPETGSTFVRFEVLDASGQPVALTNPIHFLSEVPTGGLPPARAAFDLAGVRSVALRALRILSLERRDDGSVELTVEGEDGTLIVAGAETVNVVGLSSGLERRGAQVEVTEISGRGTIVLDSR